MWEIRENMGHRKSSEYECGYEDGYRDAMKELESLEKDEMSGYRMGYRRRM